MTIAIGVVASESKRIPDHLTLCADTLGSFGDAFSTASLHKIFIHEPANLFAVGAHDLTKAGELVTKIGRAVEADCNGSYGKIYDAICIAAYEYKSARFRYDVVAGHGLAPERGWMDEAKKLGLLDRLIKRQWPRYSIECELIIGTFAEEGSAHLFYVEHTGIVHPITMPGFCAVGSGGRNAHFWLAYRGQHIGMGPLRSAYHAYEAKLMAEKSPHVGKDDIEMIVASADQWYPLSAGNPEPKGCAVSFTELRRLWDKYGVPSTDGLE